MGSVTTILASRSVDECGIRRNLLEDLALKILYGAGELSLHELGLKMGLRLRLVEELFERLRREQFFQVTGMAGGVHRIVLTASGKSRALELLAQNQYTGPAPVSLEDYQARVQEQALQNMTITRADVQKAFAHLVLDADTLTQLGAAAVSGRALFLHGPTGTGKSIAADGLTRLFGEDKIWLPYAVEVDGHIISVYDSGVHEKVEQPQDHDGRWVLCRRPRVTVGGELMIDMLDLHYNTDTKFYTAPIQMKANNGILIIDDLGRQRISPEQLLNRWVVPLERRIDFLTLAGRKLQVPFDLFVVFATNLDPAQLVEEAFLRRIQTKIRMDFATPEHFHEIFRRACGQVNLTYDEEAVNDLIAVIGPELRPCYPRDVLDHIMWAARFEGVQPHLDRASVSRAWHAYTVCRAAGSNGVNGCNGANGSNGNGVKDRAAVQVVSTSSISFGPLQALMDDPAVTDILIDNFDKIYVERKGKLNPTDLGFKSEQQLRELIDLILSAVGRRVDQWSPMADARLADGSRVNVIIPPLAIDGPSMSIRRFRKDALQLQDLINYGALTEDMGEVLKGVVRARLNVLISGGTGSGKTTLLNVLSGFIPSDERIVSVEDSAELQLKQQFVCRLETRPPNIEGKGEITQRDLVKNSLRMRPDRIVVGEVRGAEVLDMLQAMNTGHDGSLSTIHANSPRDALGRLETLVAMSGLAIPHDSMQKQIASAIDIIIQVARLADGSRKLVSFQEITGMEGNVITMQEVFRFEQQGLTEEGAVRGEFRPGGIMPKFAEKFRALGIPFPKMTFDR